MLFKQEGLTDIEYQLIDRVQLYNLETVFWKTKIGLSHAGVKKVIRNLKVVTDGLVKCCYCDEFLTLPYIYVVNEATNQFVAAFDFNLKNIQSIQTPYNYKTKIHPHVSGNRICMGTYIGKENGAIDAITLGLNPDSPYCNIPDWLASLGHFCEKMGNPCPTHGHTCLELPEMVNELQGTISRQRFKCQREVRNFINKECPICSHCQPYYLSPIVGHCEKVAWGEGIILFEGAVFNKTFALLDHTDMLRNHNSLDKLTALGDILYWELQGRTFDMDDQEDVTDFLLFLEERIK